MTQSIISVEKALNLPNTIFIDVRSESEFLEASIPGSINIPILKNEERSVVGKVYRNESVEKAKSLGLRYASYKLEEIYKRIMELERNYDNIVIYCWRGGMRSKSVCNILNTLSLRNVYRISGGYKAYRKFVFDFLDNEIGKFKFIVLHGLTGVGKTIIINKLQEMQIPVMDLEKYAKNSGSVFGDLLFEGSSPSQKEFESLVFNSLYYNSSNFIIVESESKRIGSMNVPEPVMKAMEDGYHILVETSIENRIENIYNDYIKNDSAINDKLIRCIKHLKKSLGTKTVEMLTEKINSGDYRYVIEFLINNYYDPLYKYSIKKLETLDLTIKYDKIDDAVDSVKKFIKKHF